MNDVATDPLVTIAIPTYNQKRCVAAAIESALNQSYPNLEILIADDFSSDNMYETIEKYLGDSRIKYYRNEKNLGRTANYRRCLYEYATGDWYLNLDGDDILTDNNFISDAVIYLKKNQNIVLVTAACIRTINSIIDYTIVSGYNEDVCIVSGKDFFLDIATQKAWISHLTSLYNRKKAVTLNFYHHDILSSDYESLFRLILTGDVLVFKKVAGEWRIHTLNESNKIFDKPQLIVNNFKYIESAACFAKSYLPKKQIAKWKVRILKDQVLAVSLKFLLKKPSKYFNFVLPMITRYPGIIIATQFRILGRVVNKIF